jgi:hypothetical protein
VTADLAQSLNLAQRLTAAKSGADETIFTPAPDVPAEMKEHP